MDIISNTFSKTKLNNSIFTNKNFILLFLGKVVSNLGDMIYIFAALILGLSVSIVNISIGVVFQKTINDEFRGRVSSLLSMLALAAMPFGYLIGGVLVEVFSIHIVVLVISIILITLSICMYSNKAIKEL